MRISACMVFLLSCIASVSPALAEGWVHYTPADQSFSVDFPSYPKLSKDGSDGYVFDSSPNDHETYIIEITQFKGSREYMSAKLFAAADQSFTDGGGSILTLQNLTLNGHPAQDVKLRTKEGFVAWDRLVAINDRVYQLLYISDLKGATEPDRFWQSFTSHF